MPTLTIVDSSDPSGSSTFSLSLSGAVPRLRVETLLDFVKTELTRLLHTETADSALLEFNGHRLVSGHRCGEYGIQDGSVLVLSTKRSSVAPVMIETLSGSSSPVPPVPQLEDGRHPTTTSDTATTAPVAKTESTTTPAVSVETAAAAAAQLLHASATITADVTAAAESSTVLLHSLASNPPPTPCRPPPSYVESPPPPVRAPSPAIPKRMSSTGSLIESRSSPVVPTRRSGTGAATPDSGTPVAPALSRDSPLQLHSTRATTAESAVGVTLSSVADSPPRLPLDGGRGETPILAASPSLSLAGSCSTPTSLPPARLSRRASMKSSPPHGGTVERASQSPIIPSKKAPSSPHSGSFDGATPLALPPPTDGGDHVLVSAAQTCLTPPPADVSQIVAGACAAATGPSAPGERKENSVASSGAPATTNRAPHANGRSSDGALLQATSPAPGSPEGSLLQPSHIRNEGHQHDGVLRAPCTTDPLPTVWTEAAVAASTAAAGAQSNIASSSGSSAAVARWGGAGVQDDASVRLWATTSERATVGGCGAQALTECSNAFPTGPSASGEKYREAAGTPIVVTGAPVRDPTPPQLAAAAFSPSPAALQKDIPTLAPEGEPGAGSHSSPSAVTCSMPPPSNSGDSRRSSPHTPLSARSTPLRGTLPSSLITRHVPVEACTQTSHRSTPLGGGFVSSVSDPSVASSRPGIGVSQSAADIIARLTSRARACATEKAASAPTAASTVEHQNPSAPPPPNNTLSPRGGATATSSSSAEKLSVTRRLRVVAPGVPAASPSRAGAVAKTTASAKTPPQTSSVRAALSLVRAAASSTSPRPGPATSRSPAARAAASTPHPGGKTLAPAPRSGAAAADSKSALVRYRELLKQQQRGGTKRTAATAAETANQALAPHEAASVPSPLEAEVTARRTRLADLELLGRAYHQLQELRLQTTMVRGELAVMSHAVREASDPGARIRARKVREENLRTQLREVLQRKHDHDAGVSNLLDALRHIAELCATATAPLAAVETQLQHRHDLRSPKASAASLPWTLPMKLLLAVDHEDDLLRTEEEQQRQSCAGVLCAYHEACRLEGAIQAELHDRVERECLLSVSECDVVKRLQAAHDHQMDVLLRQKRQLATRIRDDSVTLRRKGALTTKPAPLEGCPSTSETPTNVAEAADADVVNRGDEHNLDETPEEAAGEAPQPIPLHGAHSTSADAQNQLATVQRAAGELRDQYQRLVEGQRHATVKFLEDRQRVELQLLETRNHMKEAQRRNQALVAHHKYLEQRASGMDPDMVHLPEILADRREHRIDDEPPAADALAQDGATPAVRKRFLSSFRPAGATQGPTISSMVRDEVTAEVLLSRAQNMSAHSSA